MNDPTADGQKMSHRTDVAAVLADLLDNEPDVRPGKMFGQPAWYTGSKLFVCVMGDGVGLKLPAERIAELVDDDVYRQFKGPRGSVMREWVMVVRPAEDYAADVELLRESRQFTSKTASKQTNR